VLLTAGLTALLAAGVPAATDPDTSAMDDDQFVEHLERTPFRDDDPREQLDLRRLSKLLFSVGATLGGGKTNVRMLQSGMQLRESQSGRGTRPTTGPSSASAATSRRCSIGRTRCLGSIAR
jgi:hypothetical protein